MKRYEGMFIVKPDMNEDELKKTVDFIEETIARNGGRVTTCEKWARRRLAYSIKKYMEGEYYLCQFEAPTEAILGMEDAYKLNDNILRILITVK